MHAYRVLVRACICVRSHSIHNNGVPNCLSPTLHNQSFSWSLPAVGKERGRCRHGMFTSNMSTSSTSLRKKKGEKKSNKNNRKKPEWGSLYPSVHAWVGV